MSITGLFETLHAPLSNSRWSWGGVDHGAGRVFLRAWQDQTVAVEGKRYVRLAHHSAYVEKTDHPGYQERVLHLELIRQAHSAFVVMCRARDPHAHPREIASYNDRDLFKIGDIIVRDGDEWGEIVERIPVRHFR